MDRSDPLTPKRQPTLDAESGPESEPAPESGPEPAPDGLLREFAAFLRHHFLWWLLPVVIVLVLAGTVIVLVPVVRPFVYP